MKKKLIPNLQTDSLEEQPIYAEIPPRPVATITQGKKTNRLVKGINNYFGELKYKLNNNEIPTGKYTIPAVFLTAATGPTLVKSLVSNPIGFAKGLGWSIAGGEGVNAGSKVITGKTWGENVNELTGLDEDVADYTNVGYLLGPKMGKILKNGFSKVINRPGVYEILPNGKEVKLPTVKKKSGAIYEVLPNGALKMLPTKETPLKLTNNIFGKKLNVSSLFTPDEKSLYEFGEKYAPINYFRERLNRGGWDKLGITEDSYIMIPKTHRFVVNDVYARNLGVEPVYGNDDFVKVNTQKFITKILSNKPEPTKWGSEYNPITQDIYVDDKDWLELIEPQIKDLLDVHPDLRTNLGSIVKTHEAFHLALLVSKLQGIYRNKLNNEKIAKEIPLNKTLFPGVDYKSLNDDVHEYFTRSYGTEMMARFSQLRDYYGIYDPKQPLTIDLWNHAKKHYPFNNNMREFFNSVTNPKKFINHMNKIVPIGAATVYGLSNITNENKENENEKEIN